MLLRQIGVGVSGVSGGGIPPYARKMAEVEVLRNTWPQHPPTPRHHRTEIIDELAAAQVATSRYWLPRFASVLRSRRKPPYTRPCSLPNHWPSCLRSIASPLVLLACSSSNKR